MSASCPNVRIPRRLAAVVAISSFAFTGLAMSQLPDPSPQEEVGGAVGEPMAEDPVDVNIAEALTLDAGVTYATAYYFRGALQLDDSGAVFQPYAQIGADVANADNYEVNTYVGTWNSFHTNSPTPPTSTAGPDAWYESRLYGGAKLSTGDFEFGGVYTFYTSPNNAFNTIQEVGLTAAWAPDLVVDESNAIDLTLGLNGGVYFETEDQNGTNDAYFEVGVTPGFDIDIEVGENGNTPVSITFPVVAGFSIDDYFFDDTGDEELLGFISVGAQASVPLPIPLEYGRWTLTGGVQALFLEADSLVVINEDNSEAYVGSIAVGVKM